MPVNMRKPESRISQLWLLALIAACMQAGLGAQVSPPPASLQADPASPESVSIPITLEKGTPLNIALDRPIPIRQGEPVEGVLLQPIYSFDREAVPKGSKVLGRISAVKSPGR